MGKEIAALNAAGRAEEAVGLYELFLAGCDEKAQEVDDSGGGLGQFFQELFSSWVKARQKALSPAGETVRQIIDWMENDDYGFCYELDGDLVEV